MGISGKLEYETDWWIWHKSNVENHTIGGYETGELLELNEFMG